VPGKNRVSRQIKIEDPKLWWPWDQGTPELYRVSAVIEVGGKQSDAVDEAFGFREIEWERNPGSPKSALDWTLVINGRREFLRGANVVPPDSMHGRRTDERCVKLLEMAKDANLNSIRLWGGGNRERSVVYDTCDRLGIMVWQEFPIGCINFGTPRSQRYLKLLEQESSEMVRQLRNHPGLIQWCGGNEFNTRMSRPALKIMKQACKDLDPARRFVPASPHRGDMHNWLVWHIRGNLSDYFNDKCQMMSEFGFQAAPSVESLKEFLPGDLLWPIGKGWTHHHLSRGKIGKYVKHFGGPGATIEDYVNAGQKAQAYYLHRGIEHWRRQKYKKSGALFWQWNDPYPCVSWSVVDYYFRTKKAYEAVRIAFQPLLISAEFEQRSYKSGDHFSAGIVLVNDTPREFKDIEIEAKVSGDPIKIFNLSMGADKVESAGEISIDLPRDKKPVLELIARQDGEEVSRNRYDLTLHDPEPANIIGRRLFKRWWQFLTD
jgi:beta-mannosidase